MASIYSNHYNSAPGSATKEVGYLAGTGGLPIVLSTNAASQDADFAHGRVRKSIATLTIPIGTADNTIARMITMRSGDRITDLTMTTITIGVGGTLTGTFGVYQTTSDTAVDADIFDAAVDFETPAFARAEAFDVGALTDVHRGTPLWVCTNVGASSYDDNPNEQWDLAFDLTITSAITTAPVTQVEVTYIAGD